MVGMAFFIALNGEEVDGAAIVGGDCVLEVEDIRDGGVGGASDADSDVVGADVSVEGGGDGGTGDLATVETKHPD